MKRRDIRPFSQKAVSYALGMGNKIIRFERLFKHSCMKAFSPPMTGCYEICKFGNNIFAKKTLQTMLIFIFKLILSLRPQYKSETADLSENYMKLNKTSTICQKCMLEINFGD